MKIQYELSLEDFRQAQALARRTHKAARFERVLLFGAPSLGAILILAFLATLFFGQSSAQESLRPALFLGIGLLLAPLGIRSAQKKSFERMFPTAGGDRLITVCIDEQGVASGMPGVAETRYGWGVVKEFVEGQHISLIYVAQVNFLMLPKRATTEAQLEEIKRMFQQRGIRVSKC